jgi:hypothetical protein
MKTILLILISLSLLSSFSCKQTNSKYKFEYEVELTYFNGDKEILTCISTHDDKRMNLNKGDFGYPIEGIGIINFKVFRSNVRKYEILSEKKYDSID